MKIKLFVYLIILTITSVNSSTADDCIKFNKLSKEYAKCTSDKIKKETSQKAEEIKSKTAKKIEDGKKKLKNFNIKDKLKKFKNSKTHKEFTEK